MYIENSHVPMPRAKTSFWRMISLTIVMTVFLQMVTPTQLDWLVPWNEVASGSSAPVQAQPVEMSFQPPHLAANMADFAPRWANQVTLDTAVTELGTASLSQYRHTFITADESLGFLVEAGTFDQMMNFEFTTEHRLTADTFSLAEQGNHTTMLHQFEVEIVNPTTGLVQHEFEQPVRVTADLRDYGIDLAEDGGTFFIAYRNPDNPNEWLDVPITTYDKSGLIAAEVTHFSEWATGWRPESWGLQWELPTAAGFSGAATYNYPIEVPAGYNGLQPSINLSYSSGALNGVLREANVGTIATGWSINQIAVIRTGEMKPNEEEDYTFTRPLEYRLVLNGTGHRLMSTNTQHGSYANSEIFLLKDNPAVRAIRFGDDSQKDSVVYWIVQTGNGTSYRLGYDPMATTKMDIYRMVVTDSVDTGNGFYTEWHVDTVTDAFGNMIVYERDNSVETDDGEFGEYSTKTLGSRVKNIYYNFQQTAGSAPVDGPFDDMAQLEPFNENVAQASSRIQFIYDTYLDENGDLQETGQLIRIETYHGDIADDQATRQYDIKTRTISYTNECKEKHNGALLTTSTKVVWAISESSRLNGHGAWQLLPIQRFEYEAMSNFAGKGFSAVHSIGLSKNGECFNYHRLTRVENGYGGAVEFTYQSDERNDGDYEVNNVGIVSQYPHIGASWYVTEMLVRDGVGHKTLTTYDREGICYIQSNTSNKCDYDEQPGTPHYGSLAGFEDVTTRVMRFNETDDALQITATRYYTNSVAFGQPFYQTVSTAAENGDPELYQKTETSYHDILVDEIHYRPVKDVTQTSYNVGPNSGNATHVSRTEYSYNATAYGQLDEVKTIVNGQTETVQETTYDMETTGNRFWVSRVEKQELSDGSNNSIQETTYNYGIDSNNQLLPLTIITGLGSETTTVETIYNERGQTEATIAPNGTRTEITYDSDFGLYPVRVNTAVGLNEEQCTYFDIYGVSGVDCAGNTITGSNSGRYGLLYRVIDTNNNVSKYEYDAHGRLIASYAPNDQSVAASTITYKDFATPFQIQTDVRDSLAPSTIQYFDGLGRPFMTEQLDVQVEDQVKDLLTLTGYNEMGQVVRQTVPIDTPTDLEPGVAYTYDPQNDYFRLSAFSDRFTGSSLDETAWEFSQKSGNNGNLDNGVTVGNSLLILDRTDGAVNLRRRDPVTIERVGDDVWGFDFMVSNPGDARFVLGVEFGSYVDPNIGDSSQSDYRSVMIESPDLGQDDGSFRAYAWQQSNDGHYYHDGAEANRDLLPWVINTTNTISGVEYRNSHWYSAKIRRSESQFTIEIARKDDPEINAKHTIETNDNFNVEEWRPIFQIQQSEQNPARIRLDNYYEFAVNGDVVIYPAETSTVFGYSDPNDDLYHPGDTKVIAPDGSETVTLNTITNQFNIDGHTIHSQQIVTDALNNKKGYLTNGLGQLAAVQEYGPNNSISTTRYQYDVRGNLVQVTDPLGNQSIMEYDAFGRKTSMHDPDMGSWTYGYDISGNLTWQKDANDKLLCFYYDSLNRMTDKAVTADTLCPTSAPTEGAAGWLATYLYDEQLDAGADPNYSFAGIYGDRQGLLTEIRWARHTGDEPVTQDTSYEVDADLFRYDNFARMRAHTRHIYGNSYTTTSLSYDALNRPTQVIYPGGDVVETVYDSQGANELYINGVWSNNNYQQGTQIVSDIHYNAQGQMTKLDRADAGLPDTTYQYYGATGSAGNNNFRLKRIQHGIWGGAATDPADYEFYYDKVGNITTLWERGHENRDYNQRFSYDHLYRLISATLYSNDPSGTTFSDSVNLLNAELEYHLTYSYNEIGNMTGRTERVGNSPTTNTTTLVYPGGSSVLNGTGTAYTATRPHAVTLVNNPGTDNDLKYTYDANGNMITRDGEYGENYLQTFDSENRLVRVVEENSGETTRFAYDPSGQRTVTIEPNGDVSVYPFPSYQQTFESQNELVYETSFETGHNWTYEVAHEATWFRNQPGGNSAARTGNQAMAISNHTWGRLESPAIAVSPNQTYEVSFYARGAVDPETSLSENTQGYLLINKSDGSNELISLTNGKINEIWTQYTTTGLTMPANAESIEVRLHSMYHNGWIAYDDVAVNLASVSSPIYETSFENGHGWSEFAGHPETWFRNDPGGNSAARSGQQAYSISNHTWGRMRSQSISVTGGQTYEFSFWARGAVNEQTSLSIDPLAYVNVYDANGNPIAANPQLGIYPQYRLGTGTLTADWVEYTKSIELPANAASVELLFFSMYQNGWVAYDDVKIVDTSNNNQLVYETGFEAGHDWVKEIEYEATWFRNDPGGNSAARSGQQAYSISNHTWGRVASESIDVVGGESYKLSFWARGALDAKTSFSQQPQAYVSAYDANGVRLNIDGESVYRLGTGQLQPDWAEYSKEVELPANAATIQVRFFSMYQNGWVAYDDLTVERVRTPRAVVRKTYMIAGQPIATSVQGHVDTDQNGLFYIFTDHLGSANTIMGYDDTVNNDWVVVDHQRFRPFGERETAPSTEITERGFTGHHENRDIGLTYMNARFYVPYANRFLTPDLIVPNFKNPQEFNRYGYVTNNPINHTDPTGRCSDYVDCGEPMTDFSSTPEEQKAAIDLIVGFIPYVETANDLLTVTTGCGIGCRMTGVEDTSSDRRWAAVGLASPVGGRVLGAAAGGITKAIHRQTGAEILDIARGNIRHGDEMGHLSDVSPHILNEAMDGYKNRHIFATDGTSFVINSSDMRQILSRHHPKYFGAAGTSVRNQNSGFDMNLSIEDIGDLAQQVMTKGYATRQPHWRGGWTITATIDGKLYELGTNGSGHIYHFVPLASP